MATATDEPLAGDSAGERVPSIGALIAGSSGPVENARGITALDDLRADVQDREREDALIDSSPAATPPRRKHRKKGTTTRPRDARRRARERGELAPDSAPNVAGSIAPAYVKKAEIAAQLETAQSELAALRARSAPDRLAELGRSLEMLAIVGYGIVAETRGPHWALTPDEAHRIGESSAVALAPYAETLNQNLPWLAAVTTLAAVTFKRVQIDREHVRTLSA